MNPILSTVIGELAKTVVIETAKKASSYWGKSELAYEKDFEKQLEKHLKYAYEKNSMIKTLIYKNQPKYLKNFYEPLNIYFETKIYETINIENIFNSLGNNIIITGIGGMGKSTLMRYLYLNCIEDKYALPILVELRDFEKKFKTNPNYDLLDYLFEYICLFQLNISKEIFLYALNSGKVILLLDGFDELGLDTASHLEREIKNFSLKYNACKIIVSSRPSNEFRNWHFFIETTMCKLSKEQSISLIQKLDLEDQNLKDSFISILETELYDTYTDFASIPLLLTIMLLTYKENASIPKNIHDFYDKAFNTLFYQHDAQKGSYQREIQCNLNREEFKDVLIFFAFNSYFNRDFSFTEDEAIKYLANSLDKTHHKSVNPISYLRDLEKSVCILIKDGNKYKFIHRSFQEYFAAIYLTKQDDNIQCNVVKKIVEKHFLFIGESTFVHTLKLSQPSRFEKNVIYGLGKDYKALSYREFFSKLFVNLEINKEIIKSQHRLTILINEKELYFIHRAYEYLILEKEEEEEKENIILNHAIANELINKGYLSPLNYGSIVFNDIKDEDVFDSIVKIVEPLYKVRVFYDWLQTYSMSNEDNLTNILGLV
ncbi:MAG: NACHT domain-containing protein [Solibacillus sp.]